MTHTPDLTIAHQPDFGGLPVKARVIWIAGFFSILVGCVGVSSEASDLPEFVYYGTNKTNTYRSMHLAEDFQAAGYGDITPEIAVIMVPNTDVPEYRAQSRELIQADPENRTFVIVTADRSGDYVDGYHMSSESTQLLYESREDGFHILLLDGAGDLLFESDEVVPASVIERYFPLEAM